MEESTPSAVTPKNSNLMYIIVIVVIILAGVGFFIATKPKQSVPANNTATMSEPTKEASSTSASNTPSSTVAPSGAMKEDANIKKVTVSAKNFSFTPSTITVKKGQKVKITFQNTGGFHDFNIDEFKVKTPQITANSTADVTFTPDKTGTFEYYCSVGNHRAMGMVGKLIVE